MNKPRLTLMTSGYRLNNILPIARWLLGILKKSSYVKEIDLTWCIGIDSKNAFGSIDVEDPTWSELNKYCLCKLGSFTPKIKLDPNVFNDIIREQYKVNHDEREFFLVLDDDNIISPKLLESFIRLYHQGYDIMYFNMMYESGITHYQGKRDLNLKKFNADPSRTAFDYKIWSEFGEITNDDIHDGNPLKDYLSEFTVYDITWYPSLLMSNIDRVGFSYDSWTSFPEGSSNQIPDTIHNGLLTEEVLASLKNRINNLSLGWLVLRSDDNQDNQSVIYINDELANELLNVIDWYMHKKKLIGDKR